MINSVPLTESEERIAKRTAELVLANLHSASVGRDLGETVECDELMIMLKCRSLSAMYRRTAQLGIRPYSPGKYRRKSVENAIAKADYDARKNAQRETKDAA